jgi:hypothetical protein
MNMHKTLGTHRNSYEFAIPGIKIVNEQTFSTNKTTEVPKRKSGKYHTSPIAHFSFTRLFIFIFIFVVLSRYLIHHNRSHHPIKQLDVSALDRGSKKLLITCRGLQKIVDAGTAGAKTPRWFS